MCVDVEFLEAGLFCIRYVYIPHLKPDKIFQNTIYVENNYILHHSICVKSLIYDAV